jgi:hypothetical protein
MTTEREAPATNRPYPPPSNMTAVLQRLRSRNLPEHVNIEYLRDAGIPDGTLTRTFFGLRFLGLVNEYGEPSSALRQIATSTDEEYQTTLAGLMRTAYEEVFASIDPSQDDQSRIVNFFRRYTPASQRDRMVIFFLGMCREAGIPTLDAPRRRETATASRTRSKTTTATKSRKRENPSGDSKPPGAGTHSALEMLIRSLPPVGQPFPADRREQWMNMAKATLEFMYPETTERQVGIAIDGSDEIESET